MLITLLLSAGLVVFVALTATAHRPSEWVDIDISGDATADATVVGLGDAVGDTLSEGSDTGIPLLTGPQWNVTTVAALCDVEDFLDCLEAQGYAEREMIVLANSSFAVRWR